MSLKLLGYDPWLTKMTLIKGRLANIHWTPTLCKKQETEMEKQTHPDTPSGWAARCSYLLSCDILLGGCLNRGCEPRWVPPPPTQHPYLQKLPFIPNSPMSVPAFVLDPTVPRLWTLEGLRVTPICVQSSVLWLCLFFPGCWPLAGMLWLAAALPMAWLLQLSIKVGRSLCCPCPSLCAWTPSTTVPKGML